MSNWFRTYGFADVHDGLMIGAYPLDANDVGMLGWMRIERVLNLVEDQEYRRGQHEAVQAALAAAGIGEYRISMTDYAGLPAASIEAAVEQVNAWLDDGVRTYIHCRAGWQRSAAVAAAVVAVRDDISIDDALAYVQARKPSAEPLPHQRDDLRHWWETRASTPRREGGGS
jgi:protein-tyrosine phosphatase